jgi:hypothetical protein
VGLKAMVAKRCAQVLPSLRVCIHHHDLALWLSKV